MRSRIKHLVYFLVFYTGTLKLLVKALTLLKKKHRAVILFYHRFTTDEYQGLLPRLDVVEFERQMRYVRGLYSVISMDDVSATLQGNGAFRKPSVVVTIDDGYRDNYTLAYPILHQLHVPALIYLTSGLVGTDRGTWVDDIEFALMNARVKSFHFPDKAGGESIEIATLQGKKRAEKHIFSALLKRNSSQRKEFMERIVDILDVDALCLENRSRVMLDWEEISEMGGNGISFGAHTLTHPFLPALASDEAKHEIAFSRHLIERWTKKPVKHFAVPNGQRDDFTDELRSFCDEIGFDTVVTTESGTVDSSSDRLALKRALPPGPLYYFACEVARYLFL